MTTPESLYLAYRTERPPLGEYDIKRQRHQQFFGTEFTFRVIGDSHCVAAPALGFYELFSCKPVQQGRVTTVPLVDEHRPTETRVKREKQ
jgi:hypothetical protein